MLFSADGFSDVVEAVETFSLADPECYSEKRWLPSGVDARDEPLRQPPQYFPVLALSALGALPM
jgi:hypothetical protein